MYVLIFSSKYVIEVQLGARICVPLCQRNIELRTGWKCAGSARYEISREQQHSAKLEIAIILV
jgi:hypothetical protein